MKYRSRIYYSETDKALMWDRWRATLFAYGAQISNVRFGS